MRRLWKDRDGNGRQRRATYCGKKICLFVAAATHLPQLPAQLAENCDTSAGICARIAQRGTLGLAGVFPFTGAGPPRRQYSGSDRSTRVGKQRCLRVSQLCASVANARPMEMAQGIAIDEHDRRDDLSSIDALKWRSVRVGSRWGQFGLFFVCNAARVRLRFARSTAPLGEICRVYSRSLSGFMKLLMAAFFTGTPFILSRI